MALLKIWEGSRGIMRVLVIQFVCWLGCFSTFALAQSEIGEGVTGSVNFPVLGITCVSNLAVFVTSLIRGRLDLEIGARDVIEILLTPKLQSIKHGYGLTTCIQGNAANEGGGDLPAASAEQVPQTASREESDVHAASTRGTETASTEGNVNTSASTERGGLQTEIVIHIGSPEGQAAAKAKAKAKAKAAAAKAGAAALAKAGAAAAATVAVAGGRGGAAAAAAAAAEAAAAAAEAAAEAAEQKVEAALEAAAAEEEAAVAGAGAAKKAAKAAAAKAGAAAEAKARAAAAKEAAAAAAAAAAVVAVAGGGGGAATVATKAAAAALEAALEAAAEEEAALEAAAAEEEAAVAVAVAGAGAGAAKKAAKKAAKAAAKAAEQKVAAAAAEAAEEAAEEAAAAAILFARKKGLKSAAVIMLSNDTANWSMKQFMKSNAYVVQSIVLPFLPLKRVLHDTEVSEELTSRVAIQSCECRRRCHCIVFWTMEEITDMLATRMPATLKRLSNSLCLLPCSTCLRKGCHECNPESEADEGQPMRQRVVSDILDNIRAGNIPAGKPISICIPMNDALGDDWTKLLLKSLRCKDAQGRGVTNMATEALEGYLAGGRRSEEGTVEYDIFSFVLPRLTEVLINLVLTFWFRVDGFSSALVARRTVRDYLVDTKSSGFAANAFLTEATVKSYGDNNQVCQVLTFRGSDWLCFITFISGGFVNVICALGWALLISFEGGPDASQPPSLPTVLVIIAAIGSPWVMTVAAALVGYRPMWDGIDNFLSFPVKLFLELFSGITTHDRMTVRRFVVRLLNFLLMNGWWFVRVFVSVLLALVVAVILPFLLTGIMIVTLRHKPLIVTGLLFEIACLVSWIALGIKGFGGRWLYAALQILIWLKWAIGSYFLNGDNSSEFLGRIPNRYILIFYSSAFWLNAVLAGVRCKWEAWPWKHNHLF